MATTPRVVVVGAGIVGCALADELTARGHTDVTVLEQGPLFATGGSTSHAPGLVFQTTGHRTMTRLARATVAKYSRTRLDGARCFRPVGGLEVATTPERLADLRRRQGWAAAAGIETRPLDASECAALYPLLDREAVLGGLHIPSDGLAVPLAAAEAQARAAIGRGARFLAHRRVDALERAGGRVRAVVADGERLPADVVVACAGMWGPLVGALADVPIPLVPMAHQYAKTSPLAELEAVGPVRSLTGPVGGLPILRHQDADLYVREHGTRLGIGAYGHRAMPMDPADLDTPEPETTMPSERLFTAEDFDPSWDAAVALLPALRETKVEEGINGVFSFTPDGMPLLGEHPELAGFWSAEAVWITHSAGVAEAVAEWITTGSPSLGGEAVDLSAAALDRFDPALLAPATVRARACRAFDAVYDIAHPQAPDTAAALRRPAFHGRQVDLGAVPGEHDGWERPLWYQANGGLPEVCEVAPRDAWAGRHWSPVAGAEALVAGRAAGLADRTAARRVEVTGPGAAGFLEHLATSPVAGAVGGVAETALLDPAGRLRVLATVSRLAEDRFLVEVATRPDVSWLRTHVLGDVAVRDVTAGTCALALWGPRVPEILTALTGADRDGVAETAVGPVPVVARRDATTGLPGVLLVATADLGVALWDAVWTAGARWGVVALGQHAVDALRLAGDPTCGAAPGDDPLAAGLAARVRLDKGPFLGRAAVERRLRAGAPARRLVTVELDDPRAVVAGDDPVHAPGETAAAGHVTVAGTGTDGRALARAWLPAALAAAGTAVEIATFGERLPGRVAGAPHTASGTAA